MRILLFLDRYFPTPLSSARMFRDLARELGSLGHEVMIVTGDDALTEPFTLSREGNVTVARVRSGKIRHASKVMRTLNEARLSAAIWRSLGPLFRQQPYDLVVCYSPTIFWSGIVRRLKSLNNCRAYLVLRDLFPQWALDAGLLRRSGPAYWYFKWQERRLYDTMDVIAVQSPANLDYFASPDMRGRYRLEVLYNWTSVEHRPPPATSIRARLGLDDRILFIYGGNLGVAQDMDNLLRLAANVRQDSRILILLVGDGSEYERLRRTIESNGLTNVVLVPTVSQDEYQDILAECDVGLITLRRDLRTQNFPGKMLGYMELQKPMLASINPGNDLQAVLEEYGAGFVCINGDDETFRRYALRLASDPELRRQMGTNGRRLLDDKFAVAAGARQILAHFI